MVLSALIFTVAQQSDPSCILVGNSFADTWESLIKAAAALEGSPGNLLTPFSNAIRHRLVGVSGAEYAGG